MQFQKIYIEISNICNLQCTFCPEVVRDKYIMSAENFESVLKQALPLTKEITLHLMGEPLTHPELARILDLCDQYQAVVNLTTNGTLLNKYSSEFFLRKSIKQINFSIHSFKDNYPEEKIENYLFEILTFSKIVLEHKPEMYINYRLWNLEDENKNVEANKYIIDTICTFFQSDINEKIDVGWKKSKNIKGRIYFHFDSLFDWPNLKNPIQGDCGFCYGLSSHIGIHAEGTVVPCCLDKEANINLGNIFETPLETILRSEKAQNILNGFKQKKLIDPLCQRCTFIKRFDKK